MEFVNEHSSEYKNGNDVDDEGITTPSGNHVEVRKGAHDTPKNGAGVNSLDPQVEGCD